jgi:hypothetical protein
MSDAFDFVNYLAQNKLVIDVWAADSLIHLGTASIPLRVRYFYYFETRRIKLHRKIGFLKFLLRQGLDAIQANIQCSVVQCGSISPAEEGRTITAL